MNVPLLLADNNTAVRKAMAAYLLQSGYVVSEAATGKEALRLFRDIEPRLIITDVSMPYLCGLELLKIIKNEAEDTPVIIISGEDRVDEALEGLRLGAWDYLSKPVTPLDLLKHSVERSLERAELRRQARKHQQYLEATIAERTSELEKKNLAYAEEIKEKENLQAKLLHANKLESVGQLAAGIAHEINTPVQFVSSNVGFLDDAFTNARNIIHRLIRAAEEDRLTPAILRKALTDKDWPYLDQEIPMAIKQSREGLGRVASIVRAMKEFSHPGGKELARIDINHLIEITVTVARNEWKYGSDVTLDLASNLPEIHGLTNEIGQALLNLLVNAAHAITEKVGKTPEGGKGCITIKTEQCGPWILIHISDTGCGIPDSIQERIFDPFFTTKEVGKGTGQGLAIAYDVVTHKHGGKLTFSTIPGKGTTFTVQLPTRQDTKP